MRQQSAPPPTSRDSPAREATTLDLLEPVPPDAAGRAYDAVSVPVERPIAARALTLAHGLGAATSGRG